MVDLYWPYILSMMSESLRHLKRRHDSAATSKPKATGLGFRFGDCATTTVLRVGCLMVRLVSLLFDFVKVLFLADPVQILTREGSAVEAESGLGPGAARQFM